MGRIQTNIGLITGIPIADTVNKLMQLAARPRELLSARTENLKNEQVAVTELSALLLSVQYIAESLGKESLYDERQATSSDESVLSATVTASAPLGSYRFTPLRMVQSQQLFSSGLKSDSDPLGAGKLTFRFGGHVEQSVDLDHLGGGQGWERGKIRITDRSGASAEIDLTTALTLDGVLEAINGNRAINVTAEANGDAIRLVDNTGASSSNLRVEEVGGGTTAATLGLAGINVASATADGQDMLWLSNDLDLDVLNDGAGVFRSSVLADIHYTLSDGTEGDIDLSPIIPGSSQVDRETTLGEILDRINAAAPGKLQVEIAPDGDRLVITDLTSGAGTFQLDSLYDSTALADLGLDGQSVGGAVTGRRILGGMKTVLLSSLNGGHGLGTLGSLDLTDRSGATATVDLSAAETLQDVLEIINAAPVGISASISAARTGIELVDTTGASASNLVVASADATGTAEKLAIAVDADVTSIASGDMYLEIIAENTRLDDLNGGAGVARGKLRITDSGGRTDRLNLDDDIQTIGDVIREINRLDLDIEAEINATGDGIRIKDLAGGPGTLSVSEEGSTTAADLHLLGGAVEVEINGQTTQVIDGSVTYTVELDDDDSLIDLRDKINELGAGVTATTFSDGSSKPYRLSLVSDRSGKAGALVYDTSQINLTLQEAVAAQDALLVLGELGGDSPVIVSSSSNTFTDVLSGVTLQIKQPSTTPVTITVDTSDTNLVANVQTLVDNYNGFRERLAELTQYDIESDTRSILTGDATALRLDTGLSRLLSGSFAVSGSIQSLRGLGISLNQDGTLSLDASTLKAKVQSDAEAVEAFFTDETSGFSAKLEALIEGLAGESGSTLGQRIDTLAAKIAQNEASIQFMDDRLAIQRDRLLLDFYRLEAAIGRIQTNLSVLDAIRPLPLLTVRNE